MKILRLNLKRKWWEQIRDGVKTTELRLANDYWRKRLVGRVYDEIHLCLGYPKKGDDSRVLKRKWRSIAMETVLHEEFGDEPVEVFVIEVGINSKKCEIVIDGHRQLYAPAMVLHEELCSVTC